MYRTLEKQLKVLAVDPDGSFEKNVRDRWGETTPPGLVKDLKDFILLMPTLEKHIFHLWYWLPSDSRINRIGSKCLTYLNNPDDFLPPRAHGGLFGYLDDAYMLALFYELMVEEIQSAGTYRIRAYQKDLLKKSIKLRRKARAVIPEEAIQIKQLLGELLDGEETTFQELFEVRSETQMAA